jgi:hypothetical protein
MSITVVHTVELTDEQVRTILFSLRFDYRTADSTFGALPVGVEYKDEIRSAYEALSEQTGVTL